MSEINEELLRQVVEFLEANPEKWEQDVWLDYPGEDGQMTCGTTGCIAGWTVLLSPEADLSIYDSKGLIKLDNREEGVFNTARRLLGLDSNQADSIFLYIREYDPDWGYARPVTWEQMKARITNVTGIEF